MFPKHFFKLRRVIIKKYFVNQPYWPRISALGLFYKGLAALNASCQNQGPIFSLSMKT